MNNDKLKVNICGVSFNNPVISASGTFGFGHEFKDYYKLSTLGGIALKGITLEKRNGNAGTRIAETPSGILNSVGLQNPGVEDFVKYYLPTLNDCGCKLIANIAGSSIEDYVAVAKKLNSTFVDMFELNISCPNVKTGGMALGVLPKNVKEVTNAVKQVITKPLIVKLTPNVSDIQENAFYAEQGGADAISLINTLGALAVNYKTCKPILGNVFGGLSGPAVKPIALKMVWQVYNAVKVPIIGMGGIESFSDVLEFIICGASAVQVGTANIYNPMACVEIIEGLESYLNTNKISNILDLKGKLKV